ncbi:MAG TPA: redoxin domain-containing protein, partial [Terriglobales bacterium]|nr:redoxin domain-containing protein [Terriglobales bacterium]
AQVVGVSVDSIFCHTAWQKKDIGMLRYPLCSDFYPHGAVAKKYKVLRTGDPIPGINDRTVFIIDKGGKIVFAKVYPLDTQPDNQECLEVLRKL